MIDTASPNYAKYVTSVDDANGKHKAHFFDLVEKMLAGQPENYEGKSVIEWLRNQPSNHFACESMNRSVVIRIINEAAKAAK